MKLEGTMFALNGLLHTFSEGALVEGVGVLIVTGEELAEEALLISTSRISGRVNVTSTLILQGGMCRKVFNTKTCVCFMELIKR